MYAERENSADAARSNKKDDYFQGPENAPKRKRLSRRDRKRRSHRRRSQHRANSAAARECEERRAQEEAQGAAGAEGAEKTEGTEGAEGAEGEVQEEKQPPPAYQAVNPPVEQAPEPDAAEKEQAEIEKQESLATVEAEETKELEDAPEELPEAPANEEAEPLSTDPTEAAATSSDPEAAAPETQGKAPEATGAGGGGVASTAGPITGGSTGEMFSAYVSAQPTEKAAAHGSFAGGVHEQVSSEHESFEGGIEDLHATMNGEADVEIAQQEMNLGEGEMSNEAGERSKVQLEETPAAEGFKDNEPVLDNIFDFFKSFWDNLFGGDDGRDGIMDSFGNIRDSDRGANKNTGPIPVVPLKGDSDTKRVATQQRQATQQTTLAHEKARQVLDDSPGPEVVTPLTMDEAFAIPTLNAPTVNELPAEDGIEYLLPHDLTPELTAAFDGHYGPDMQAHMADAEAQVSAAMGERDLGREATINDARTQHEALSSAAQQAQAEQVISNREMIIAQRQETHHLQGQASKQVRDQMALDRKATMGDIKTKFDTEQKKIDERFGQAEIDAQAEVDAGDREAKAKRDAAEKEADEKSIWEKAGDFVSSCFDAIKSAINSIFDAVRAAVNTIIDTAKTFATTIIDLACEAICGIIDAYAEAAKLLVKTLLSETFPEFSKDFCAFVTDKQDTAKEAIHAVADEFKAGVEAVAEGLKEGINAVLDVYQSAINSALELVEAVATGDWAEIARKLITAGALVFGLDPNEVLGLLDKAGESITMIVDDPFGFVSNVLGAVNQGFGQFGGNILDHLQNGFVEWLAGPIPGLQIPEDVFSMSGAFDLAMQVLGVTPDDLKAKAARHIGEENVEMIEEAWTHIEPLIQGGWGGLWEHVKGELADMQDAVVGSIMSYVQEKVVEEAVMFIAGLFSPLPGIPKVVKVVWETYCWLQDNIQRIYGVVDTVVNTMHDLATGNIQPAADGIESALAGMVPIAIDLLAGVLGLGDLPEKIQGIIQALQDRVDAAIDKAIDWAAKKVKGMFSNGRGQDDNVNAQEQTPNAQDQTPIKVQIPFQMHQEEHTLHIEINDRVSVKMASETPRDVDGLVDHEEGDLKNSETPEGERKTLWQRALELLGKVSTGVKGLKDTLLALWQNLTQGKKTREEVETEARNAAEGETIPNIETLGKETGTDDIDKVSEELGVDSADETLDKGAVAVYRGLHFVNNWDDIRQTTYVVEIQRSLEEIRDEDGTFSSATYQVAKKLAEGTHTTLEELEVANECVMEDIEKMKRKIDLDRLGDESDKARLKSIKNIENLQRGMDQSKPGAEKEDPVKYAQLDEQYNKAYENLDNMSTFTGHAGRRFLSQFHGALSRYIGKQKLYEEEMKGLRNKGCYSGFVFTEIPFISTSKNSVQAAKYAKGKLASDTDRRTTGVVGRIHIYVTSLEELIREGAIDVVKWYQEGKLHFTTYRFAEEEVTFTGSIPQEFLKGTNNVEAEESAESAGQAAHQIAQAQGQQYGGLRDF